MFKSKLLNFLYYSLMFLDTAKFAMPVLSLNFANTSYSGSGHNHRTSIACFNNKVAKNRTRNKISKQSRTNNW